MDSAFIFDGYSRDAVIPAVKGLHPQVRVRFRPALMDQRLDFLAANRDYDAKDQLARIARVLEAHLESWDAKIKGETAARSVDNIRRLQPSLLQKLLDLVLGYAAADEALEEKNSATPPG